MRNIWNNVTIKKELENEIIQKLAEKFSFTLGQC